MTLTVAGVTVALEKVQNVLIFHYIEVSCRAMFVVFYSYWKPRCGEWSVWDMLGGEIAHRPGHLWETGVAPFRSDTTPPRTGRAVLAFLGSVEGSWVVVPTWR